MPPLSRPVKLHQQLGGEERSKQGMQSLYFILRVKGACYAARPIGPPHHVWGFRGKSAHGPGRDPMYQPWCSTTRSLSFSLFLYLHVCVYRSICPSDCSSICQSVHPPAYPPTHLPTDLPTCRPTDLACPSIYLITLAPIVV